MTMVDYLLKISKIEYRKEPEALLGYKGRVLTKPALSEVLSQVPNPTSLHRHITPL